jgi:hypothetical protein
VPRLHVGNGYSSDLYGLATLKPLSRLTQKRVTVKVRTVLRDKYGRKKVKVSCEAKWCSNRWTGECQIAGEYFNYEVR